MMGLVLFVVSWSAPVEAACSGSGTSWSCTAGSTVSQINTAINSASDGATITFANGSYTWSGFITPNAAKGLTLACATPPTAIKGTYSCDVTATGGIYQLVNVTADTNALYRITGFYFHGSGGGPFLWFIGSKLITSIRVDHNKFSGLDAGGFAIGWGDTGHPWVLAGVVDHNYSTNAVNFSMGHTFDNGTTTGWLVPGLQGGSRNIFYEDNVMEFTQNNASAGGCADAWGAAGQVFRFNTATNCRAVVHGYAHNGPANYEVYYNSLTDTNSDAGNGYRLIHHQGSGQITYFMNALVPTNPSSMAVQYSRDGTGGNPAAVCDGTVAQDGNRTPTGTYLGYPCYHQPGRDGFATMRAMYFWGNTADGTPRTVDWGGYDPNFAAHVVANRDYYDAGSHGIQTSPTSPFNGTTGMGWGTLANRPTTCTPTSESLDAGHGGVGYWATDQGSWNTSSSNPFGVQANGADGILYTCTATNTWTATYTPYPYPHPLQGTGGTIVPSPPTLLDVTERLQLVQE